MNNNTSNGIPVKLYIKSIVSDLMLADMINTAGEGATVYDEIQGKNIALSELADQVDDVIEYTTEGALSKENNRITVRYGERADMGFDNTETMLSFDCDSPQIVTLVRTGDVSTVCRFDTNEPRQHCTYDAGVMPLELTMNTRSVQNSINGNRGKISLDYTIEMRGVKTERNRFSMEVTPIQ